MTTNARSVRNGDTIYSPMFRALIKGRGGDRDFKDGASGVFRLVEVVGKEAFIEVLFDGFGSVHSFKFHQDGSLRVPGRLVAEGASLTQPAVSTHPDTWRIVSGNKGTFWRFDGSNVYLMMTNEGDPEGGVERPPPVLRQLENRRGHPRQWPDGECQCEV